MGDIIHTMKRVPTDCLMGRVEEPPMVFSGQNLAEAMSCCCGIALPGDLIIDILSRLPVKSLLRFKCVCKTWKYLVESPTFIYMHMLKKNRSFSLLIHSCTDVYSYLGKDLLYKFPRDDASFEADQQYLRFRPCPPNVFIAGSSNGIVCIGQGRFGPFILWNPATRLFKYLPLSPPCVGFLVFAVVKFAFLPNLNDYKLVRINQKLDERVITIDTFTVTKNSWMRTSIVMNPLVSYWRRCVLVNGYMHWSGYRRENHENSEKVVVSFDMSEETFHQTRVPFRTYHNWSLANLNESLAMFVYNHSISKKSSIGERIEIWVTNYRCDATRSWTKHSVIEPLSINIGFPFEFWLNDEEIIFTDYGSVHGFIKVSTCNNTFLYNRRDGKVRKIPSFQGISSNEFIPHVDTLFQLNTHELVSYRGS